MGGALFQLAAVVEHTDQRPVEPELLLHGGCGHSGLEPGDR